MSGEVVDAQERRKRIGVVTAHGRVTSLCFALRAVTVDLNVVLSLLLHHSDVVEHRRCVTFGQVHAGLCADEVGGIFGQLRLCLGHSGGNDKERGSGDVEDLWKEAF